MNKGRNFLSNLLFLMLGLLYEDGDRSMQTLRLGGLICKACKIEHGLGGSSTVSELLGGGGSTQSSAFRSGGVGGGRGGANNPTEKALTKFNLIGLLAAKPKTTIALTSSKSLQ